MYSLNSFNYRGMILVAYFSVITSLSVFPRLNEIYPSIEKLYCAVIYCWNNGGGLALTMVVWSFTSDGTVRWSACSSWHWWSRLSSTTRLGHGVFWTKARWCWELLTARERLQEAVRLDRVSGKGDNGNATEGFQTGCWWGKGRFLLLFNWPVVEQILMLYVRMSCH